MKKILLGKIFILISLFAFIGFVAINYDNWVCYIDWIFRPSKSLCVIIEDCLCSIYGTKKAVIIERNIERRTVEMIESGFNIKSFWIITAFMLFTAIYNAWIRKKVNKKLIVSFFICILIMYYITYVTSPYYARLIYD